MKYDALFTPMRFGMKTAKNRFVMTSMSTAMCSDNEGFANQRHINYYEKRAAGGFGVINVELAAVCREGQVDPKLLFIDDDKYIPGLAKVSQCIKKHGALAICQLFHAGRQTRAELVNTKPVSASPIPCPADREIPRMLTTEEVYALVPKYVSAARRAKEAGFDGVQVHCGHGYLLDQFLSPRANKRTDEFGGTLIGRSLIVKMIIEAIKAECGNDYPVSVRITSVEGHEGGITRNLALAYAKLMEEYGADVIELTAGSYGAQGWIMPPPDVEMSYNMDFAKKVKENVSVPVGVVGRNVEPILMNMAIEQGYTDFVELGRQSIADPDIPNKLKEGRDNEVLQCLSCGVRCLAQGQVREERFESIGDYGISCVINPLSANRPDMPIEKAEKTKKVMVVGAGPGGLEAAWISAMRGHDVTLYEKNSRSQVGGQFYYASFPPYKNAISQAIRHYYNKCEKYGVKMVFDTKVTEEMIRREAPDVLFLATGAKPLVPNIPGLNEIPAYTSIDVLGGKIGENAIAGNVLIVGGGQVALETAEFCVPYVNKISIVEMQDHLADGMYYPALLSIVKRFRESGMVDINLNTKVIRFKADGAICECDGKQLDFSGYDFVIVSVGSKPYRPFENIQDLAPEVYQVGDANKVRSSCEAFFEAAKYASQI